VVLAVAHVRGGGELGSAWHAAGRKLNKTATFDDLRAAARHLVHARYTSPARLGLWGRSAGGLTLAAAINMALARAQDVDAPATAAAAAAAASGGAGVDSSSIGGGGGGGQAAVTLAGAAVLDVPFLDVLGDMSDPSLPLTVKERREWGDPLASSVRRWLLTRLRRGVATLVCATGAAGPCVTAACHSCDATTQRHTRVHRCVPSRRPACSGCAPTSPATARCTTCSAARRPPTRPCC
jgi:hypothetical protein